MSTRRNLAFGAVFAGALLLAQAQMAPYQAAQQQAQSPAPVEEPPPPPTTVEEPPAAEAIAPDGGGAPLATVGDAGAQQAGLAGDAGTPEQILRSQLATQEDQVRLLQQQVASQQASQETLARTQLEVQGLRQQLADAETRAYQEQQAEVGRINSINNSVQQLEDVNQQIIDGNSTIDFGGLSSANLPPDAETYVRAAEDALSRSDYLYARYYVELAVSSARTSLIGNGANAVQH